MKKKLTILSNLLGVILLIAFIPNFILWTIFLGEAFLNILFLMVHHVPLFYFNGTLCTFIRFFYFLNICLFFYYNYWFLSFLTFYFLSFIYEWITLASHFFIIICLGQNVHKLFVIPKQKHWKQRLCK